jgi:hypothetical protein
MRFAGEFIKHKNCMDAFFHIVSVDYDNNNKARLSGYWMIQGIEGYWKGSSKSNINITPKHYNNWLAYSPKGEKRFV